VLRSLVINADDLGLTAGVNTGIFDAHDHGILTSASLFANAPATSDAIRRVRSRPSLGVGVHLTLVDGTPALPPQRVPTLVQEDGRFRASWKPFIVACLLGQVSWDEVERELTAQIWRVRSEGIRLTHLDSRARHARLVRARHARLVRAGRASFRRSQARSPLRSNRGRQPSARWPAR
jgi:chitin disaccharide deacetylase